MLQSDQVITKWAPALLQMTLDDLLWKDSDNIQVWKLWEYLSTYCYLPRLSGYSVLEETICQGVVSDEYFGIAAAFANNRYVDPVRVNKVVSTYVDEIIRHLMQVEGASVELKLEVDVTAPYGIPATTVRTVSENCKTLKITDFGFDE